MPVSGNVPDHPSGDILLELSFAEAEAALNAAATALGETRAVLAALRALRDEALSVVPDSGPDPTSPTSSSHGRSVRRLQHG